MMRFAEREEFELAMEYREKLSMLSKLKLKRLTALNRNINADIIALKTNRLYSAVNVLVVRGGIMQGGQSYALEDASLSTILCKHNMTRSVLANIVYAQKRWYHVGYLQRMANQYQKLISSIFYHVKNKFLRRITDCFLTYNSKFFLSNFELFHYACY